MGDVLNFTARDGSRQFVCTDCGYTVFTFCDFEGGDCNVCRSCQFIGEHPQLSEEAKALLRGPGPVCAREDGK